MSFVLAFDAHVTSSLILEYLRSIASSRSWVIPASLLLFKREKFSNRWTSANTAANNGVFFSPFIENQSDAVRLPPVSMVLMAIRSIPRVTMVWIDKFALIQA